MLRITKPPAAATQTAEHPMAAVGRHLVRYTLVLVIAWIGALKYGNYEASAIQPLVAHSPILSWVYHILSVRAFAAVAGTVEITAALLIAIRPLPTAETRGDSGRIAMSSAMGVLLFLSTAS